MVKQRGAHQPSPPDLTLPPTGRPPIRGTQGIVSAGHHLTAMSAMGMLLRGGNAFDAAVAAGFTAAVIEPTASFSLAAEASIMLYHAASRQLRVLSGQGVAPARATVAFFRQRGLEKIPTGPGPNAELSFTVPGVVGAFILMLETYGTKSLAEAAGPAIEYAQRGFPVYEHMRSRLKTPQAIEQFKRYPPGGAEIFYPGDMPPKVGQLLIQKQLASTLKALVHAEYDAPGSRLRGLQAAREMFYGGETARTIVQCSDRVGGLLDQEDLSSYRATFEEPIRTTYMGHEICAQSTWTQGVVLLQALNILDHFDLRGMGHNSPQYIHTVAEALKLALADRERYYGDPNYSKVPIDGLVSKGYASTRAKHMRGDAACPELPEAGDPWQYSNGEGPSPTSMERLAVAPQEEALAQSEDGTTHFAVIDRDGNMVCATPSGGVFAKSVFFPELGCTLSTRSEMFFLDDQHPNGLQPGKRPRTTLVNYIVCKDGEPIMTIGCPGGDNQAQADLQLVLNVLLFGMDPQQAVEAPRFSSQSVTNSFYPRVYLPGQLNVEPGIPEEVRSKLAALGHKIVGADTCGIGAVVTQRDPESGALAAGADPRRPTYALGW